MPSGMPARIAVSRSRGALALLCLLLGGCYFLQSVDSPVPAQFFTSTAGATGLVILLPGFGDGPQDYVDKGFVDILKRVNPAFDVSAVNAHFGYYRDYSIVQRLHEDIVEPARAVYDEIWLVGISMGGFGASAYAMTYPENIDGLILLAPFMGSRDVVEEVMTAGTLGDWQVPELSGIDDEKERTFFRLWQFYRQYAENPGRKPRLYLGYGDQDRLRFPNAFVAEVLVPERSLQLPGGHQWVVWKPLFTELAERAIADR